MVYDAGMGKSRTQEFTRSSFSLFAASLMIFSSSGVGAQCAFDAPAKAKAMKLDLVRAYKSCPPDPSFPVPNTVTSGGAPACAPPVSGESAALQGSLSRFDDKGKCRAKLVLRAESVCSSGSGSPCSNLQVQAKCSGIVAADGSTPISGSGWELALHLRATIADPAGGDMTVLDVGPGSIYNEIRFDFGSASNGKLKLKGDYVSAGHYSCTGACSNSGDRCVPGAELRDCGSSSATCDPDLSVACTLGSDVSWNDLLEMPACVNVEILDVIIRDPSAAIFARQGLAGN